MSALLAVPIYVLLQRGFSVLRTIRLAAILSVTSVAILAAPFVVGGAGVWDFPGFAAHAEKGGNGGGNGGGSGGGGGGNSGGESHGKSGESHGSSATSKSGGDDSGETITVASKKGTATELSERNFHAQLAGLNSLKRNINGLMNSSDPRMEGIREFVEAGAALEGALADLGDAELAFKDAKADYLTLVDSFDLAPYDEDAAAYSDVSVAALQDRLSDLQALGLVEADDGYEEWLAEIESLEAAIPIIEASDELVALLETNDALKDATDAVGTAEASADDATLKEALLLAANDNRVAEYGDEYVTDEILGWAKSVLGVGDANGAIDAYIKQQ